MLSMPLVGDDTPVLTSNVTRRAPGQGPLGQHGEGSFHHDVDGGASAHAHPDAAIPDASDQQYCIAGSRERVLPLVIGDGTGSGPADAYRSPPNALAIGRGDFPGDVDLLASLLAKCRAAQHQCQQHTHRYGTEVVQPARRGPTLTLQHVSHGGALILRVVAWPSGLAW